MDFRLLGPLEVSDGETILPLAGGRQRALLAILLLHANRTVSVERLIDDLWGAAVPDTAVKAVQIYVSRLRKVLPAERLLTRPPGYVIEVGEGELDLDRFEQLLAGGRQALSERRAEDASRLLRKALALWRGPALTEFSEPFAQPEAGRLEEVRFSALEERIEADLALGRHADLVGELEALVSRSPLRERLRGQQMLALYRCGRQADALAAHQEGRRLLDQELGIQPAPTLRELERRILQQDPALRLLYSQPKERNEETEAWARPSRMAAQAGAAEPRRSSPPAAFVGRDGELGRLLSFFLEALAGHRQVVFLTGQAGIGKTTLVETFLADADAEVLVGRGQCIEQHGAGEAYMPVLEALGRLCRGPEAEELVRLLAERAPTWLAQMPSLIREDERETPGAPGPPTTSERMLREIVEALEAISSLHPLLLVLEDLHWADVSTVDLLSSLARRTEPARLLLIATYRPEDAKASQHPVWDTAQELRLRSLASELEIQALTSRAVVDYLAGRFPENRLPIELSQVLHERTGGNPLFLARVVDSWLEQGSISAANGSWTLQASLDTLAVDVPTSVRQLIEHQVDALDNLSKELVEAASVAGADFATAAVAAASGRSDDEIEARCRELAHQGRFMRLLGETVWPDGTVSTRYGVTHDLYLEVVYSRVPPGRLARLHREIGARLEAGYGEQAREIASELAMHFVRGRDPDRAIFFLQLAAENALARSGHREAIKNLRTALDTLEQLPGPAERTKRELDLQITLGNALITSRGYAAPETKEAYARARELCAELGEGAAHFLPVLYGLWNNELVAGMHASALELAEAFINLAETHGDDAITVAHRAMAWPLLFLGRLTEAHVHLEEIAARYDAGRHEQLIRVYGEDPGIAGGAALALVHWLLGFPDRAAATMTDVLARARALDHPLSLVYALFIDAMIRQLSGDRPGAREQAEAAQTVASEHGIALFEAWATAFRGWAQAATGQTEEGIATIRTGIEAAIATGSRAFYPHLLALLADAHARAAEIEDGLSVLGEALAAADANNERYYEPEIHRLRGELLLAQARPEQREAESALRRASEVAQAQGAKALELRATVSLGRLLQTQGRNEEARQLLTDVYAGFTEGFATPDMKTARSMLEELGAPVPALRTRATRQ